MSQFISREDLKVLIESGLQHTIIEALPKKYYEVEHIPGALNIPHDEVQALAERLVPDKSVSIVVYCANAECKNSHIAAEALRRMGYIKVYEYAEGKKGWKGAGFPLEAGFGAN